jgi:hypothetical protein
MTAGRWCWIGACSTGSSHIRAGTGCQDSASCMDLAAEDGSVLLAVVSDGAGSATFSSIGSRLVVAGFVRSVVSHLRKDRRGEDLSEQHVRQWLDDVRDRIFQAAEALNTVPRQLAATLVGAIVWPDRAIVCHVGDGACVLKQRDSETWEVPSWPAHGEYASSTFFVTDDPEPKLDFIRVDGEFSDVAVFSDGIERLALDFHNKTASERFFNPMTAPLATLGSGRDRTLSGALRKYLDSPRVVERTDDDKSLILARRIVS